MKKFILFLFLSFSSFCFSQTVPNVIQLIDSYTLENVNYFEVQCGKSFFYDGVVGTSVNGKCYRRVFSDGKIRSSWYGVGRGGDDSSKLQEFFENAKYFQPYECVIDQKVVELHSPVIVDDYTLNLDIKAKIIIYDNGKLVLNATAPNLKLVVDSFDANSSDSSIGLELNNFNKSNIFIRSLSNFDKGLLLGSFSGKSFADNKIFVSQFDNNVIDLQFQTDNSSFFTGNLFELGEMHKDAGFTVSHPSKVAKFFDFSLVSDPQKFKDNLFSNFKLNVNTDDSILFQLNGINNIFRDFLINRSASISAISPSYFLTGSVNNKFYTNSLEFVSSFNDLGVSNNVFYTERFLNYGLGSPLSSAVIGSQYINLDNGDFYIYTATGWILK